MSVVPFKADEVQPVVVEGIKLNLGANQHAQPGFVNVDIEDYDGIDVVADLEKAWPWESGSVAEIVTNDLPEHLRQWYERPDDTLVSAAGEAIARGDALTAVGKLMEAISKPTRTYGIFHFMGEAHRVLKPGGLLKAQIPTTDHRAWAQDPTHVSYWNENTMLYFLDDGYRNIYPREIKGRWNKVWVGTSVANPRGESWIRVVLEKVA